MLSTVELEILQAICKSGSVYADVGVDPGDASAPRCMALRSLRGRGYVAVDGRGCARITNAGIAALTDAQQDLAKAAQQIADQRAADDRKQKSENRRQRSEWARFWIGLLLGWLLGALTPLDLVNLGAKLLAWIKALVA